MILIELEGGEQKRFRLEFHPRVTVAAAMTPEQRQWCLTAVSDALAGRGFATRLNVDVDGEPQLLTPDLVAQLGLARAPVDNVLGAADLPGAVVMNDLSQDESQPEPSQLAEVTPIIADESAPLKAARAELKAAQERLARIESELEKVYTATYPVDDSEIAQAAESHKKAVAKVRLLYTQRDLLEKSGPSLSPSERLRRALVVRDNLHKRIADLTEALKEPTIDIARVKQLLIEAQHAANEEEEWSQAGRRATQYLQAWSDIERRLQKASQIKRPPEWLVSSTRDQLEEAKARVHALTIQFKEGIEVHDRLERAKRQLVDAEAAWDELHIVDGESVGEVENDRSTLYSQIVEFLGEDPGIDQAPRALTEIAEFKKAGTDARDELSSLLVEVGINVEPQNVISRAVKYLDSVRGNSNRRAELSHEISAVKSNIEQVEEEIAELEIRVSKEGANPDVDPLTRLNSEIKQAELEAEQATDYLNDQRDRVARYEHRDETVIARLEFQQRDAQAAADAAGQKVDYFARLGALAPEAEDPSLSTPALQNATPWWERGANVVEQTQSRRTSFLEPGAVNVADVNEQDVEMFVLSRAAGLRRVGNGVSVPLIINGAFDRLSPEAAAKAFEVLTRIAPIVQVVYMATNDLAEKWVKHQPESVAATVRLERG